MKIFHINPQHLLKELLTLERSGNYEEALAELDDIWRDKSEFPQIEEFGKKEGAEILLRCGSLIGFVGQTNQIPNAQEQSKNILTTARKLFLELFDFENVAECENHLALSYTRSGEYAEAEVWLEESLGRKIPELSYSRIHSYLIKAMIFQDTNKFQDVVDLFDATRDKIWQFGDDYLLGSFCTNLGIAHRNLGNTTKALKYYAFAEKFHTKSGHRTYLGTISNNVAYIYISLKEYEKALNSVDKAIDIYREINDKNREGSSLDTKAEIYFARGNYTKALELIEESIKILEFGENFDFLLDSFSTKVRILVNTNKISDATFCLFRAVEIANRHISETKGKELVAVFEEEIKKRETIHISNIYTEKELNIDSLELIFPPEFSNINEIEGIWIKNSDLENAGLFKGSLAIISNEEIKKGDLIAIAERETEAVSCGFYDSGFGILCLNAIESEPQLFNEDDVQILGKIIGVATAKDEDGKMYVEPIKKI